MWDTFLFVCAICGRDVRDYADRRGPDRQVDPVCRYCEGEHGGPRTLRGGSFMDRRKLRQLNALAEVLGGEARRREWEAHYARA